MHDALAGAPCLLAAAACALAGMAWLALAMPVHAQQAWGRTLPSGRRAGLRWSGGLALVAALACCLVADHASMAVLVWLMLLAAAAVATALLLAYAPGHLAWLAPWIRRDGPAT